ncbi:alpha/beta hydrolase [Streptomyces pacificus]|nr:hypothetical protein [Streptomyces pacificus]
MLDPAGDRFFGPRPAVLVLPGGGVRELPPHEGEGCARRLSGLGIHAFVPSCRLLPDRFPAPLEDARAGSDHIRNGDHGLDVGRAGVIGSGAGGQLAGLLMTGRVLSVEEGVADPPRPDFAIPAYAPAGLDLLPPSVVENLHGDLLPLEDEPSPAMHVDASPCPAFAWATAQDPPGQPEAPERTRAPAAAAVPVESHVSPGGGHGIGLAGGVEYGGEPHTCMAREPHTASWTAACAARLRREDVLAD